MTLAAGHEIADRAMQESRHTHKRHFSRVAFAFLATFAFFDLLGAGFLLALLSGTSFDLPVRGAADLLKDALLLSPALLPSCAIVALVTGHITLSRILVGVGVLAALLLTLAAVAAQVDVDPTFQSSTPVYAFSVAFLFGLITLFLPFRAHRDRKSM